MAQPTVRVAPNARKGAYQAETKQSLSVEVGDVVYAIYLSDERLIKIGCTSDLMRRVKEFAPCSPMAFMPGGFEDEAKIHARLKAHRARGREYYRITQPVLDEVNLLRAWTKLPQLSLVEIPPPSP